MIPVNEKADARAQEMLKKANAMTRPVDLKPILDKLRLELRISPMSETYSGFLAIDKRMIVVNERHPEVQRRFTAAHEIGHYDLHRGDRDPADMFVNWTDYFRGDDKQEVYFRHRLFGPADCRMEVEADAYAAGLLMPETLLEQYLEQNADKIDLSKPEGAKMAAQAFNVSRLAMGYRLSNLGLAARPTR